MKNDYFAEIHFYASGVQHMPIALSEGRPEWAPAPDYVGFRDEFLLAEGDVAIEWRRMEIGGQRVNWLAVYQKSIDESFGDRGNHAGIGIWLKGIIISDNVKILQSLYNICQSITKRGDPRNNKELKDAVTQFLQTYISRFVTDISGIPDNFNGVRYSKASLPNTTVFLVPRSDDEFLRIGTHINFLSVFPSPASDADRFLFRLSDSKSEDEAPLPSDTGSIVNIVIPTIRSAVQSLTSQLEQSRNEIARLSTSNQNLLTNNKQQSESISNLQSEVARYAESEQLVEEGVSPTLVKMVTDIKTTIDTLSNQSDPVAEAISRSIQEINNRTQRLENNLPQQISRLIAENVRVQAPINKFEPVTRIAEESNPGWDIYSVITLIGCFGLGAILMAVILHYRLLG